MNIMITHFLNPPFKNSEHCAQTQMYMLFEIDYLE